MRPLLVALVVLIAAGCVGGDPPASTPTSGGASPATTTPGGVATTSPTLPTPGSPAPATPDGGAPGGFVAPSFSGEEALGWVREQVLRPDGSIRHRVPGTEGNAEVASLIESTMEDLGYDAWRHDFVAEYGCEQVPMHNVIAQRNGTSGRAVVFAAHYDTRPIAEKDPDPARRDEAIPGANDGASGVAVLLELARVAAEKDDTLRFVFFDGEDGGGYKGRECTDWILGSRAYNASLTDEERSAIRAFILVDMVGDHRLSLPWEMYSRQGPGREVQDRVYGIAHGLGHTQFRNETGYHILDDHKPFVDAGVPAIDLIHLVPGTYFPDTHHTHADDLDHVSAESLAAVGRTLETWWRELE